MKNAFFSNDPALIRRAIEEGQDVRWSNLENPRRARRDREGNTPLHVTTNVEAAELLIRHGADVNARDRDGLTPLHRCHHDAKKAALLIGAGADVHATNNSGVTPLHVARSLDVATLLVQQGANVNAKTYFGASVLHYVHGEHADIVAFFIRNGVDVNSKDSRGRTPLHMSGSPEMASELIRHGADLNAQDRDGNTALHLLKRFPDSTPDATVMAVERVLLDAGADPFIRNHAGQLPRGEACEERRKVITQQKHLEAHLAQVPSPAQVSASVGQGEGGPNPERPKRRL